MLPSIGQMDVLVTVQARSVSKPGFPVETFVDLPPQSWMSKAADTATERSAERFAAGQLSARAYTEWHMPYRADMDPDLVDVPVQRRLVYRGRVHDILSAELMERRQIRLLTLAKVSR
jgi:hypothetical protein